MITLISNPGKVAIGISLESKHYIIAKNQHEPLQLEGLEADQFEKRYGNRLDNTLHIIREGVKALESEAAKESEQIATEGAGNAVPSTVREIIEAIGARSLSLEIAEELLAKEKASKEPRWTIIKPLEGYIRRMGKK